MANMRAKLKVIKVENFETSERLTMSAVGRSEAYPSDGTDENNTFAKFTPNADLSISITNPALLGTFREGQTFYVDFSAAE